VKILIVEDDKKISSFIKRGLEEEYFSIDVAYDGEEGFLLATLNSYDVIILDWMLPKMDGVELCKKIRTSNITTPVLMLTAKSDIEDKVFGLENGADDYLSKPFAFEELIARVKALHRRNSYKSKNILTVDDLKLNPLTREVTRGSSKIELSVKEYELLEFLMRNRGRIVTNAMIMDNIWDMQQDIESNVINVYIHHLRNKIDKNSENKLIHTVRGAGYRIG